MKNTRSTEIKQEVYLFLQRENPRSTRGSSSEYEKYLNKRRKKNGGFPPVQTTFESEDSTATTLGIVR